MLLEHRQEDDKTDEKARVARRSDVQAAEQDHGEYGGGRVLATRSGGSAVSGSAAPARRWPRMIKTREERSQRDFNIPPARMERLGRRARLSRLRGSEALLGTWPIRA